MNPTDHPDQPATPPGLTLSEDGTLLNWQGENYVRQSDLPRYVPVREPFPSGQEPHATVPPNGPVEVEAFVIYPSDADPDDGTPPVIRARRVGAQWVLESDYLPEGPRGGTRRVYLPRDWDAAQAREAMIGVAGAIRSHVIAQQIVTDSATATIAAMIGNRATQ